MKTTLIVFVVLLFLLTLLGSFGGSIRTSAEPFYDETSSIKVDPYGQATESEMKEKLAPIMKGQAMDMEQFGFGDALNGIGNAVGGAVTGVSNAVGSVFKEEEKFYNGDSGMSGVPTMDNMPNQPPMPNMTIPQIDNAALKQEDFYNYEKFDVPSPFEDFERETGAPL